MILLDTNYLLRFLTNDIKTQAADAKKLIKYSIEINVPVVAIAETVYFLRNYYKIGKTQIVDKLTSLLQQKNIKCESYAHDALQIYEKEIISFYDCLILGEALKLEGELKTFDEKLQKVYKKYLG